MATLRVWLNPQFVDQVLELYEFTIENEYVFLMNLIKPGRWNPSEPWLDPYSIDSPLGPGTIYSVKFPVQLCDGVLYGEAWVPNFTLDTDKETTLNITPEVFVDTVLSLNGPAQVYAGQDFDVDGVLQRIDTMEGLPSLPIEIYVDGSLIGTTTTDALGAYLYSLQILVVNGHVVEVVFPGANV